MLQVIRVASLEDPRLAPYRTLRDQRDHFQRHIFVAEGEKIVRRLLASPLRVASAVMPERWVSILAPVFEARPELIPVFVVPKAELEKLTGFSMYQGVLAVGEVPLPADLDTVLEGAGRPRFLVALDGLNNAENMGAIVRNAVGFGVQALLLGETCSHPYLRRSVRTSMGTIFKLPAVECTSLYWTLTELQRLGIACVAAHPHAPERWSAVDARRDLCVVLGNEGVGLSEPVLRACECVVSLPMQNEVDSLNVSSAAVVFFYEVARQRGWV